MATITFKTFQQAAVDSAVALFDAVRDVLDAAGPDDADARATAIYDNGYLLIEAPTGSGKSLMAGHIVEKVSEKDNVVWFWFAPFKGVVDQSAAFLREQFHGLRLRTMTDDRKPIGTQSGDVFVTTWGLVATRLRDRRSVRQSGEQNESVDDLVESLREQGFRIGVVVDEAHHSFKGGNQAAAFFREVLDPEYTILVTATPDDGDLADLKTRMQVKHIHKVAVSRSDAVGDGPGEGLIKRGVKAIAWRLQEGSDAMVDFETTALRAGADLHQLIKLELKNAGIDLTPLMLVQVGSGKDATEVAKGKLKALGFTERQIAVHTSAEPDPGLLALANNEEVEVLIFKMAVALGFDAPRAFSLVSMRAAKDEDFGVQLVGRILRVHRRLQGKTVPALLRYGYVLLADLDAQGGLDAAGQRINRIQTEYAAVSPTRVFVASGGDVYVQSADDGEQSSFAPVPPAGAVYKPWPVPPADNDEATDEDLRDLFGDAGSEAHREALRKMFGTKPTTPNTWTYPLRTDVPRQFKTQDLPEEDEVTEEEVAENFAVSAEALLEATLGRESVSVQKRTLEIFTQAVEMELDYAPPSAAEKQKAAQRVLLKYGTLSAKALRDALADRLGRLLAAKGFEPATNRRRLHECLNDLLSARPWLLRDAFKRAVAARAVVSAADDLPDDLQSDVALATSTKNVYGCYPKMGSWEKAFAEHLDGDDSGTVLWWHRNEPHKPWSINVLMENGQGFFPDFIVGIKHRPTEDHGLLTDPKEAYSRRKEIPKLAAEHGAYGRVLILTKENERQRWEIAGWDEALEKTTIEGPFLMSDAADY